MKHFLSMLGAEIKKDGIAVRSAALAYYALFAFAPLLLIMVVIGDKLFELQSVQNVIFNSIISRIGSDAVPILSRIESSSSNITANIISGVAGIGLALYGAIHFFIYLRKSFMQVFRLQVAEKSHAKPYAAVLTYVRSFVYMLILLIPALAALLVSSLVSILLPLIIKVFGPLPFSSYATLPLEIASSIVILVLFFTLLYRIVSGGVISWKNALYGALGASMLLFMLNIGLKLYLTYSITISLYGAAGSVVVLLLWIYYGIQIMFIGSEIAKIKQLNYVP
jgi:membrane protein